MLSPPELKQQFDQYPLYHILTTLSYIKGTIVKDWVNSQAEALEQRVDTTQWIHVTEADEVLWHEFKTNFKLAWKDTAKTQSSYDQLFFFFLHPLTCT
jgi:hypothetical protein